jgi:DNA-binding XRE family transcriptional regulator
MSDSRRIEGLVLDHLPAAVVVSDADGRVVYQNRAAKGLFDCSPGAALPRELALAVRQQEQWAGDVRFAGRRVHCRVAPLRDSGGGLVGAITVSFERRRGVPDADLRELGSRIARARAAAGLTQQELGDRLGVTRRSVQGYEAGQVAPYRHLDRLAEILGRPRAWFLTETAGSDDEVLRELRRIVREEVAALR